MEEIDEELVARAARWCAEAGRRAGEAEVRAALAPLSWDELLAVRALLADPPPARPLGPRALVEIARGTPAEAAAEREREGRYGLGAGPAESPPAPGEHRPAQGQVRAGARARAKQRPAAGPVIRRARDRVEPAPPAPRALAPLDELFASEGRAVLERLVREHGARRGALCAVLAAGWQRAGGGAVAEDDLERLLDAHGLARSFERRERDELLHAVRAAAGLKSRAAAQLAMTPAAFEAALERLGAGAEAEAIRAARRDELRRRGTLSERVRLLLAETERLADLGLLAEVEADLRQRLPEHLRALRASGDAPLDEALARSLSIGPRELEELLARLGLSLGDRAPPAPRGRAPPGGEGVGRGHGSPLGKRPAPGARPRERGSDRPPSRRPPSRRRPSPTGSRPPPRGGTKRR